MPLGKSVGFGRPNRRGLRGVDAFLTEFKGNRFQGLEMRIVGDCLVAMV